MHSPLSTWQKVLLFFFEAQLKGSLFKESQAEPVSEGCDLWAGPVLCVLQKFGRWLLKNLH